MGRFYYSSYVNSVAGRGASIGQCSLWASISTLKRTDTLIRRGPLPATPLIRMPWASNKWERSPLRNVTFIRIGQRQRMPSPFLNGFRN